MSEIIETKKEKKSWNEIKESLVPILAVFTALVAGAIIIVVSEMVASNLSTGFKGVGGSGKTPLQTLVAAYVGLFEGAFGSPRAISETLISTTPYILSGLAVALSFRCGLFNIGAEGQFYVGSICAVLVGYMANGLPPFIHILLALLAGMIGGAFFAAIPGYLKAKFGIHEVINCIMLNYIGVKTIDWFVRGPLRDPTASLDQTPYILDSAKLPKLLPFTDLRVHIGIVIALVMVFVVYWLLFKTTLGYEIRTVGSNPSVARYAGMNVAKNFVIAMALSGCLAGLAGAIQQLGMNYTLKAVFATGYGFDSIAVALLAKSHPIGIIPAALLWGALRNGASLMQVRSNMSIDLINIVQALVIVFVAADQMIRWLYRIRGEEGGKVVFTRGWGGN